MAQVGLSFVIFYLNYYGNHVSKHCADSYCLYSPIVPPLLSVMNRLHLDRRAITCILTFGLVNTYMFIPYGFGDIFLNQIILKKYQ